MGFENIPPVEPPQFFLDVAFKRATTKADMARSKKYSSGLMKARQVERIRIETVKDNLVNKLVGILKTFPSTDTLTPFYVQLLKCTLDFPEFKRSLGALNWAQKKVSFFWKEYRRKIDRCEDPSKISDYRRQFYGRISSVMKQIKSNLKYLDECRRIMRTYPTIKSLPTVAIVGFPNVGKTTLLYKLTGSKADIAAYAFTTKGINVGYIGKGKSRTQFLDTPGTLNRFDRMNNIEKQAHLAMKLVADQLVYVFDPTEAYPLELQEKLYKKVTKMGKPVTVFISKTDLAEQDEVDPLVERYKGITSIKELKDVLSE